MPTKEQRNERFENANEAVKYLYADSESGLALLEIAKKYKLDQYPLYSKFALTVGDIILGFHEGEEIDSVLENELIIDASIVEPLSSDIKAFLKPLQDPSWEATSLEEAIKNLPQQETQRPTPIIGYNSYDNDKKSTTTEASSQTPRETKQVGYSSNEESTYSSTQSALMNESK